MDTRSTPPAPPGGAIIWDTFSEYSQEDFLETTRLILVILHNIIQDPSNERNRRLRTGSKFIVKPGVMELLDIVGFKRKETYLCMDNYDDHLKQLRLVMRELVARRRATGNPLGWDVPSSAIHFSKIIGCSKYGDIIQGTLDGQDVAIKTLKPDIGLNEKKSFKRELDILGQLSHPQVVRLVGAILLAEPTSLILELLPHSMLHLLHHGELCDVEIFRYARQVAMGMEYIHSKKILHCDLAARNLLVSAEGEVKISDFSSSQYEYQSLPNETLLLNIRWSSPEVLQNGQVSRESDIWSYGILLYEFVTSGSVPYANFSNYQVHQKVLDGYRLPQPPSCLDEFYSLMMKCWATSPLDRPQFTTMLSLLLSPMETMLASISDERPIRHNFVEEVNTLTERRGSKKCKVKEPIYQAVVTKGGGLVRVYTSLVTQFHPRVIVACSKKTSMSELVQLSLAKCGKSDLDHRSYAIALLDDGQEPVKYLGPDDKVMTVKGSLSTTAQLVLCIRTPEKSLLEVISSIKNNPSYRNALDSKTKGYLVKSNSLSNNKRDNGWQRYWCVLDGSSLLCYLDEEDEGIKQFEIYLDFMEANVSLATDKKNENIKVQTKSGEVYLFSCIDKTDTLRWIEAMSSCTKQEPSPFLLQGSAGGTVVYAGFITCTHYTVANSNPLQPIVSSKLGEGGGEGSAPVCYGKLWSVLKSSGLIQCMVDSKPVELVSIYKDIKFINVIKNEGEYSIKITTMSGSLLSLVADNLTEHYEWVINIEDILLKNNITGLIINDTSRHNGYVVLKRLMSNQREKEGVRGSQLISPSSEIQVLKELYSSSTSFDRASPDGCEEKTGEGPPLPPRGSSAPPPPLPPRDPPPLPPKKANSLKRNPSYQGTPNSNGEMVDDYIIMQPPPTPPTVPSTLRLTPNHSFNCSIPSPITELSSPSGDDYMTMNPAAAVTSHNNSMPISIPGNALGRQPASRRCVLLRSNSEIDGNSSSTHSEATPPLPPRSSSPRHARSYSKSKNSTSSLRSRSHSTVGVMPPQPSSSSLIHSSVSDGLMVREVKERFGGGGGGMASSYTDSVSSIQSYSSDVLDISGISASCSAESSQEDLSHLPLPDGWERGYSQKSKKHFFFNADLGISKWNYEEVLLLNEDTVQSKTPGNSWHAAQTEDGKVYYYSEITRQTTWDIRDTFN